MSVFFARVRDFFVTPRWMAAAYYDRARREVVMVMWPFHYAVQFAWWLNLKWSAYRHKKSWVDRMVDAQRQKRNN
jgi:hypothetical protein